MKSAKTYINISVRKTKHLPLFYYCKFVFLQGGYFVCGGMEWTRTMCIVFLSSNPVITIKSYSYKFLSLPWHFLGRMLITVPDLLFFEVVGVSEMCSAVFLLCLAADGFGRELKTKQKLTRWALVRFAEMFSLMFAQHHYQLFLTFWRPVR